MSDKRYVGSHRQTSHRISILWNLAGWPPRVYHCRECNVYYTKRSCFRAVKAHR